MDVNRILYVTSFSLTCSSDDPLSRDVFQCLVRSSLDHRAESHRVCSAASVMTMYGQQSRVHTRACLSLSWPREVFMHWWTTSLGPVALATLMSAARASSWCSCIGHTSTRVSCTKHSMFLVSSLQFLLFFSFCTIARASRNVLSCLENISCHWRKLRALVTSQRTVTTFRSRHSTFC